MRCGDTYFACPSIPIDCVVYGAIFKVDGNRIGASIFCPAALCSNLCKARFAEYLLGRLRNKP